MPVLQVHAPQGAPQAAPFVTQVGSHALLEQSVYVVSAFASAEKMADISIAVHTIQQRVNNVSENTRITNLHLAWHLKKHPISEALLGYNTELSALEPYWPK